MYTGFMDTSQTSTYTAGKLAKAAGVNIQTVRFYDRQGVLKPISRTEGGYRIYNEEGLRQLNFIIHAKELGFSLKEIKELLSLRIRSVKACERVRVRAQDRLKDVQSKIASLKKLEKTLNKLISDCEDRVVSDQCPIIEKLEVKGG